jgi:WD40 repeat protein
VWHVTGLLRRHYGKLAAALLLAGALAVLWWALPAQPRTVCRIPEEYRTGAHTAIVGFTTDCRRLTTVSEPRTNRMIKVNIQLWDVAAGQNKATIYTNTVHAYTSASHLSPNGQFVILFDPDSDGSLLLKITDSATGQMVGRFYYDFECAESVHAELTPGFCFSADGNTLACRGTDSKAHRPAVHLWNVPTRQIRGSLPQGGTVPLQFSPDSRLLATVFQDSWRISAVTVWDAATLEERANVLVPAGTVLLDVVFSSDSKTLVLACRHEAIDQDLQLLFWDIASNTLRESRDENGKLLRAVPGTTLENRYLVHFGRGAFQLCDLKTGKETRFRLSSEDTDGKIVQMLGSIPGTRECESTADVRTLAIWHKQPVTPSLWYDWLAKLLTFIGIEPYHGYNLELWDIASGTKVAHFAAADDYAFSADGKLLALTSSAGIMQIWDVRQRKPVGWFLGLAGVLLLLTLGGFWWQARRRKRNAALATETIPCST